jgi:hypothetical protein
MTSFDVFVLDVSHHGGLIAVAQGNTVPAPAVIQQFGIDYAGPAIDHLAVLIDAPQFPGVYEIEYVPHGVATAVATTEMFVQAP